MDAADSALDKVKVVGPDVVELEVLDWSVTKTSLGTPLPHWTCSFFQWSRISLAENWLPICTSSLRHFNNELAVVSGTIAFGTTICSVAYLL